MTKKPITAECSPQLIRRVRMMLCQGCTPLHIIKYLCADDHEAGKWRSFVHECFQQAFGVTLLVLPDRYESLLGNRKIQDYLNTEILHEMVSNRHLWMSTDEIADSWPGDVNTTDIWTATDQFDPQAIPEIAAIWPHMDTSARQYVRMALVTSRAYYERSLILARLAEMLQQQLPPSTSEAEDER